VGLSLMKVMPASSVLDFGATTLTFVLEAVEA